MEHVSVLKREVSEFLDLHGGEIVVDATLGLGGHALDTLKNLGKSGKLIVFEQDERNLEEAQKRLQDYEKQVIYIHDNFRYLKSRITGEKIDAVDGFFFDLGLSSPHVDDESRGFSFMKDGPLDMRFDRRMKLTAYDVVNLYKEEDMARVFFEYGEERMSRRLARKICARRKDKKFESTAELAEFIKRSLPYTKSKMHPATRIFQAIRIEVNDELNALEEALKQASEILKIGGRIVVISYHSLEDRIVKRFFKDLIRPPASSYEKSLYSNYDEPFFESLTKKPVVPTNKEIEENPRSRSAKLRAYRKLRELK